MFAGVGRISALIATTNLKNASDLVVFTSVRILFETRLSLSIAKVAPCFSLFNNFLNLRGRRTVWIR
jgi:hypothetical protein